MIMGRSLISYGLASISSLASATKGKLASAKDERAYQEYLASINIDPL